MKNELKIVAAICSVLLGLEFCMRMWGSGISLNLRTIEDIPKVRDSLQAYSRQVLIVGNSMTIEGIDYDTVHFLLGDLRTQQSLDFQSIALHGAFIGEWNWIVRTWYADCNLMPTDMVLNCDVASLVEDSIALRRVGWNTSPSTKWSDMPNCCLHSIDDRCEFLLSRISSLFSRSQDIGKVVKERLIPHYQSQTAHVNASTKNSDKRHNSASAVLDDRQYCSLVELLEMCQAHSTRVWLVWMPTKQMQTPNEQLMTILDKYQVQILAVNVSLDNEDFADANHLSESGKKKYSPAYSRALVGLANTGSGLKVLD